MSNYINNDDSSRVQKFIPLAPVPDPTALPSKAVIEQQSSLVASSAAAAQKIIDSSIPVLPPPDSSSVGFNLADDPVSNQFRLQMLKRQNQVVNDMLDNWIDALQEEAQRRRTEFFSPIHRAWQEAQGIPKIDAASNATSLGIRVIAGTEAAHATYVLTNSQTGIVDESILADWSFLATLVPKTYRTEVGLIGSLFSGFMLKFSAAQNLSQTPEGEKPEDPAFARLYAMNLLSRIDQVDRLMEITLHNKIVRGQKISEQKIRELTAFLKIVLLCVALAMLYKAETGWITGMEFRDMLDHKLNIEDDVRQNIINMINAQSIILDDKQRETLLRSLAKFFDRVPKPSFDEMLDINHVLSEVFYISKASTVPIANTPI